MSKRKINESLAGFLLEESKNVNKGFCYYSYPWNCCRDEMITYARHFPQPKEGEYRITRNETDKLIESVVEIKPPKGSRKRKWQKIVLWWFK